MSGVWAVGDGAGGVVGGVDWGWGGLLSCCGLGSRSGSRLGSVGSIGGSGSGLDLVGSAGGAQLSMSAGGLVGGTKCRAVGIEIEEEGKVCSKNWTFRLMRNFLVSKL